MATTAAALVLALVAAPTVAAQEPEPADPGTTTSGAVNWNGSRYPYLLYTPTTYRPGAAVPLVVVVHGCQTTAQQEMELSLYNRLAEREGFVVLYPEVDGLGQQLPGPLNHCWRFFDPTAYLRGTSDPAAIAAMARTVLAELSIDPERVYLVGVSAGGLMTSASAAQYPDLYAAVGIVASAGYLDALCFTTGIGIPVEVSALLAHVQMGRRARVVPTIAIGSDADLAFPATCTRKAVEQSLRTNNLVVSGTQDGPISLAPAATVQDQVPNGRAFTVSSFVDPDGCLVAERWIVHGMHHAWPGGADYGGYTDPGAPDGAETTWAFLRRYRRSDTSLPCAEAAGIDADPPAPTTTEPVPTTAATPPASAVSAEAATAPDLRAGAAAPEGSLPATGAPAASAPAAMAIAAALAAGGARRAGRGRRGDRAVGRRRQRP